MNPNELISNLNAWTVEELAPYEGKYVAWSEDGRQVLAVGANWDELYDEVNRKGLTAYFADYVPTQKEIQGGFW